MRMIWLNEPFWPSVVAHTWFEPMRAEVTNPSPSSLIDTRG